MAPSMVLPRPSRLARFVHGTVALMASTVLTACAANLQANPQPQAPMMVNYAPSTNGYLALPTDGQARHPGVVLIHEWWGLNDTMKAQADTLAKAGYVVLAVDLFKGRVATTPDQARQQTQGVVADEAIGNLKSAVNFLRSRQDVGKVASWGYCFGGRWSLQLAMAQKDLGAAVIYYGQLETDPAKLQGLPPIQGVFGEADASIPMTQVRAFDQALTQAGVKHEIHSYPNAPHAFANPTGGEQYRPEAAADAYAKTLSFLRQNVN